MASQDGDFHPNQSPRWLLYDRRFDCEPPLHSAFQMPWVLHRSALTVNAYENFLNDVFSIIGVENLVAHKPAKRFVRPRPQSIEGFCCGFHNPHLELLFTTTGRVLPAAATARIGWAFCRFTGRGNHTVDWDTQHFTHTSTAPGGNGLESSLGEQVEVFPFR